MPIPNVTLRNFRLRREDSTSFSLAFADVLIDYGLGEYVEIRLVQLVPDKNGIPVVTLPATKNKQFGTYMKLVKVSLKVTREIDRLMLEAYDEAMLHKFESEEIDT